MKVFANLIFDKGLASNILKANFNNSVIKKTKPHLIMGKGGVPR